MKGWDSQTVAGKLIVAGMPMYNEEETIGTVVTMALKHVDAIICIDDESSDSVLELLEACGAIVIRHRVNRGYGGALKSFFESQRDASRCLSCA